MKDFREIKDINSKKSIMFKRNLMAAFLAAALMLLAIIVIMINKTSDKKFSGVYLNGIQIDEGSGFIQYESNVFVSVEVLKENDLVDLFNDEEEKLVLVYDDMKAYTVDLTRNQNTVWYEKDSIIFLNINYIKDKMHGDWRVSVFEDLLFLDDGYSKVSNERKIRLYGDSSRRSERIAEIDKGSTIIRYEDRGGWSYVRWGDKLGYVRNDYLKSDVTFSPTFLLDNPDRRRIVLAWDLFTREPTRFVEEDIYPGMNVVCPTWHKLEGDTLEFSNWYMEEYVDYYRENRIEVWGTFSNSFDPDLTSLVMKDRYSRSDIVRKIVDMAVGNGYRGVNIDFENIYLKDKEKLAAFFRELYMRLDKENILMSVDVSVISTSENWSLFYDRKTIGRYSDYVVLMAYDERTLPEHGIGSIASLPWVENGIVGLLDYVRSDKIILGLPFYTRLWETIDTEDGLKYDVTSLRLTSADKFVAENDFEFEYDEETGQNYGEKTIENIYYQVWIEDETSLKKRLELVEKYDLNGVGVWSLNYSKKTMWKLIENFFENL